MEHCNVELRNGRAVSFDIENRPGAGTFFVLGVRKSGSSIFNNVCKALAKFNKYNYVDAPVVFFDNNIKVSDWVNDPGLLKLLAEGNVYGGFRGMPFIFASHEVFVGSKKVLLVRDPRDALVSEYYSSSYSHRIPEATAEGDDVSRLLTDQRSQALSMAVDEYVLAHAGSLNNNLMNFKDLRVDRRCLVLKYEEAILNKIELMQEVCGHFGWSVNERQMEMILRWADVMPQRENPKSFIRRVIPGDHIQKLQHDTIEKLNELLRPSMDMFGYC